MESELRVSGQQLAEGTLGLDTEHRQTRLRGLQAEAEAQQLDGADRLALARRPLQ